MDLYRNLLLAIDFASDANMLCQRAAKMAEIHGASLSLVHVVEPIVTDSAFDTLPPIPVDFEDVHIQQARNQLDQLRQSYDIPEENTFLEIGVTKHEILRVAQEQSIDLLLLGSHGRHGIELLLGSTANAVLHHATCDVLAIHLKKQ
ncbi:MAG: universal stress protein [Gammaproteobacteria bacterium]|nr:universal stress protein [Gammaproteobacteria bacterium]